MTQNVDGLHQRPAALMSSSCTEHRPRDVHRVRCRPSREAVQRTARGAIRPSSTQCAARAGWRCRFEPRTRRASWCRGARAAEGCSSPTSCSSAKASRAAGDAAMHALDAADAMLVVGSSLMVYSGYRFCERAHGARQAHRRDQPRPHARRSPVHAQDRARMRRGADRAGRDALGGALRWSEAFARRTPAVCSLSRTAC